MKESPIPSRRGVAIALVCLVGGVCLGVWLRPQAADPERFIIPPITVDATATQAHDNFVIATGLVDDGVEGLYFLDFMTGELRGVVLHERQLGFGAYFRRNIMEDFGQQAVKNPKYLMVTGQMSRLQRSPTGPGGRLGRAAIYVVEANSGQVVAYGVPWNPSLAAAGKDQSGGFVPLARESLRDATIRDNRSPARRGPARALPADDDR